MTHQDSENKSDDMAPTMPDGHTTNDVSEEAAEVVRQFERQQTEKKQQEANYPPLSAPIELRLEVRGNVSPLLVKLTDRVRIGRYDPSTKTAPEVDLTPFGGYRMGVSRIHALIRLNNGYLEIVDLGSRNGSYLNGNKLQGNQPILLKDGAEIRLGKVVMQVHLHRK